jgi:hypothetical protein
MRPATCDTPAPPPRAAIRNIHTSARRHRPALPRLLPLRAPLRSPQSSSLTAARRLPSSPGGGTVGVSGRRRSREKDGACKVACEARLLARLRARPLACDGAARFAEGAEERGGVERERERLEEERRGRVAPRKLRGGGEGEGGVRRVSSNLL